MSRIDSSRAAKGNQPGPVRSFAAACALAGLSLATVASAAASFSITGLSLGNRPLYPTHISSAGQTVGAIETLRPDSSIYYHVFTRSASGVVVEIPTLAGGGAADAGVTAIGYGVNATGEVVGTSQVGVGAAPHAFLYKGGVTIDLSAFLDNTASQALGINDAGVIVGTYQNPNFGNAYVLRPQGPSSYTLTDLGPGVAYAISESGYVVGETVDGDNHSVPFVFRDANNDGVVDDGEYRQLGTLGGTLDNIARDVNDSGTVVGQSRDAENSLHAVIWNSTAQNTTPQKLGSLGPGYSYATSINNAGHVVGYSGGLAFLFQNNQVKRLDSSIPTERRTTYPTWQLYLASGINNAGEIVGQGVPNNTATTIGFLLKPGGVAPPPSTVKLASFTANPGAVTLRSHPVPVTFTLGLSAKSKTAIKVPLVVKLDGETILALQVGIGKNKLSAASTIRFDQDWTPGTYSLTAAYGGVEKTTTLVINAPQPITLESLTFPSKVKRGKKVKASLRLTDVPAGTAEVTLALLDANQAPLSLLGVPIEYVVALVQKDTATARLTIPTLLPAGTYYVRASYGGVTKTVMFRAQ